MKFTRIIFAAVAIISTLNVFAQNIEQSVIKQISPLTPNAASLGKYGDVPVSLYTGIPNIGVPLYEIQVGGFTLPISLSYHAGGVQVDDVPSWVGTGWTLNAGGMINRRMRGIEDERMINNQYKGPFTDEIETILSPIASVSAKVSAASVLSSGRYDTESDIFSISTGALSHQFFLDINGNAHGKPARKLQITREDSVSLNQGNRVYVARWKVKDETGVEYIFGRTLDGQEDDFEITRSDGSCGASSGMPEFVNSWYLNQINLPTGESIYFKYEPFSFCRPNTISETMSLFHLDRTTSKTWTNHIRALRLKEIIFPTGKVSFVAGALRRDITNDNVLDRIQIFSKRAGSYFEEKSFRFITNNPVGNTTSGDESFRLALLSVTEFDKDGAPLSPYIFEYKNQATNQSTFGLPARGSFAQDLWGY